MTPSERLQGELGYQFAHLSWLDTALTHRSVLGAANNERLEFLGDAVLNCVIAAALCQQFHRANEGELSRLRASLVNRDSLVRIAHALNLGDYLRLGPGELKSGGARRESILADAVESLIGAVYEDGGFSACQAVILKLYTPYFAQLPSAHTLKDAKTQLQELLQARALPLPTYTLIDTQGEAHALRFTIECRAMNYVTTADATSRRQAEQQAARKLLDLLQS